MIIEHTFGYNWGMLTVLTEAVDQLEVTADGDTICEVFAVMDRLNAKVAAAIGQFDHDGASRQSEQRRVS